MNDSSLLERLVLTLGRNDLAFDTISIIGDLLAADARLSQACLNAKRGASPDIDLFEVLEPTDAALNECVKALAAFDANRDEERLREVLGPARDAYQVAVAKLLGKPT